MGKDLRLTLVFKRRKGPLDIPLYGMGLRCLAIGFGDGEEARGFEPELALLWILFSTEVVGWGRTGLGGGFGGGGGGGG